MRATVLAVTALLLGLGSALGQNAEWADKLFAKTGTSHNFGNIPRGAVLSHRFTLTNIYAVPLEITATRVSCGCVTATPSATTLQPRETGYIDVVMDAKRFTGQKTVSIFVTVGPQYTSTATLQVSANSRADVVFNPGEVNFGVLSSGQAPTQTIDVEYAGALDWRITGIAQHSFPLDVQVKELYREVGRAGYRLQVTLKPTAPAGGFKHEVLLQTNDPASLLVPVQVHGNIQAALSVVPNFVKFDATKVGQEFSQKVLVLGNGPQPFRILKVEGLGDDVTVDLPPTADKRQIVTLKWRPTKAGDLKRELRFQTDLNGGAAAAILLEGAALP